MRVFFALLLLTLPFAGGARFLSSIGLGSSEPRFIADLGLGALTLFGAALALTLTVFLFVGEIETRSALTLLAKPLTRTEFLLGKFFGAWALSGIFVCIVASILSVVIATSPPSAPIDAELPEALSMNSVLLRLWILCGLQWLKLGLLTAMTLTIGGIASSSLFALLASGMLFFAGQFQPILVEAAQGAESFASRSAFQVFSLLVPNLQLFALENAFEPSRGFSLSAIGHIVGYGLGYMAAFLGAAIFVFRRREL